MAKTALEVSPDNGGTVSVTISDAYDLVTKFPMVTQIFARAVANVATRLVSGVVQEVVVTIGATKSQINFELHKQRVQLNVDKLAITTDIIAEAVKKVEASSGLPEPMREEWKNQLYNMFYSEMENITKKAQQQNE